MNDEKNEKISQAPSNVKSNLLPRYNNNNSDNEKVIRNVYESSSDDDYEDDEDFDGEAFNPNQILSFNNNDTSKMHQKNLFRNEKIKKEKEEEEGENDVVDNEEEEEKKFMNFVKSFDNQGIENIERDKKGDRIRNVYALVKIVDVSEEKYKDFVDLDNKFSSLLVIVKSKPVWKLRIVPNAVAAYGGITMDLTELDNMISVKNQKQTMVLMFKNFKMSVQFKVKRQFEYFKKVLLLIIRILDIKYVEKVTKRVHRRRMCLRKLDGGGKKNVVKKTLIKISHIPNPVKSISAKTGEDFYMKNAVDWEVDEIRLWLQYIWFEEGRDDVITVYEKLQRMKLLKNFEKYFYGTKLTIFNMADDISSFQKGRVSGGFIDGLFDKKNQRLLKKLVNEVQMIKSNKNMFRVEYACVLEKRLRRRKEGRRLATIEEDLKRRNRFMWDVEECRDHLLCLLLFDGNLEDFLEKNFLKFERREMKKLFKTKNIERKKSERKGTIGGFYTYEIDPIEWNDLVLKKFNDEFNVKSELLSFVINVKVIQNELRMKKKEELTEFDTLKGEMHKKESEIETTNKQVEIYFDKLFDVEDIDEVQKKNINDKIKELEEYVVILRTEKKKIQDKFSKYLGKKREDIEQALNEEIENTKVEDMDLMREVFMLSSERKNEIAHFLKHTLEERQKVNGMSELVVKVVLAVRKGVQFGDFERKMMNWIDPFIRPGWFKFGFLHSYITINRVGIHLFSNSTVYLQNFGLDNTHYEDICAIDASCPLILSHRTTYEQFYKLAEEIVFTNVNCEYQKYDYGLANKRVEGKKFKLNCQEFVMEMIKSLDYTKFFGIVDKYLDQLKVHIPMLGKEGIRNDLRWITPNKSFIKKFEKILDLQKGRHYFISHKDLDEFYQKCLEIDPYFEINFPGEFQLLKAFDRGYWTSILGNKKKEDKSEEDLDHNPLLHGTEIHCPFK